MTNEALDGVVDITLRVITAADEVKVAAKYLKMMREGSQQANYIFIEAAGIVIPLTSEEAIEGLESELNSWLVRGLRGIAFTPKEVLKKLKRLGFREKSTEGSHVQLVDEEKKAKVTVPVHGGTLKKGTLKSILRQAGIDLNTLVYA